MIFMIAGGILLALGFLALLRHLSLLLFAIVIVYLLCHLS